MKLTFLCLRLSLPPNIPHSSCRFCWCRGHWQHVVCWRPNAVHLHGTVSVVWIVLDGIILLLLFSFPSTTTTPRPTGHCAAVESDYILPLLRNGVESPTAILLRVRPCIHPDATFSDERRTCDVACNVMIYYMFNVFNVGRLLEYTRSCCCCPCCHKANWWNWSPYVRNYNGACCSNGNPDEVPDIVSKRKRVYEIAGHTRGREFYRVYGGNVWGNSWVRTCYLHSLYVRSLRTFSGYAFSALALYAFPASVLCTFARMFYVVLYVLRSLSLSPYCFFSASRMIAFIRSGNCGMMPAAEFGFSSKILSVLCRPARNLATSGAVLTTVEIRHPFSSMVPLACWYQYYESS